MLQPQTSHPPGDPRELTHVHTGLLIIRLVVGLLLIGHGTQKLFGWFGGHGLAGTGGFIESLGHRPSAPERLPACLAGLAWPRRRPPRPRGHRRGKIRMHANDPVTHSRHTS